MCEYPLMGPPCSTHSEKMLQFQSFLEISSVNQRWTLEPMEVSFPSGCTLLQLHWAQYPSLAAARQWAGVMMFSFVSSVSLFGEIPWPQDIDFCKRPILFLHYLDSFYFIFAFCTSWPYDFSLQTTSPLPCSGTGKRLPLWWWLSEKWLFEERNCVARK